MKKYLKIIIKIIPLIILIIILYFTLFSKDEESEKFYIKLKGQNIITINTNQTYE